MPSHQPVNMSLMVLKSKDNQYFFVLKASNGKVLMTSETYKTRRNAYKTAEKIQHQWNSDASYFNVVIEDKSEHWKIRAQTGAETTQ